jgi:transposase
MDTSTTLQRKYEALATHLDERARRIWAATEAEAFGYGGISLVARATGISRRAIHKGLNELSTESTVPTSRVRKSGGGRKSLSEQQPDLLTKLEQLVEPLTRGDPESPLRWTCKSVRVLSEELERQGIKIGRQSVAKRLRELGYSLQANCKTVEGNQHPDRNAQFEYINGRVARQMKNGNPVLSVDTKKKELIGNYKNSGREWHNSGDPIKVNGHDFPSPGIPRAHPYGIYDIAKNEGFVNVGTDHDTSTFAVASLRKWWKAQGKRAYPNASRILITADGGGSNGWRPRLWKWELQRFANDLGCPIMVSHFPPGTSKWNKVEHRLFSFISQNWRGKPLVDYETVVNLISKTKTATGLKVSCRLDKRLYPTGRKVSDEQWATINMLPDRFHGEWNYTIKPAKA